MSKKLQVPDLTEREKAVLSSAALRHVQGFQVDWKLIYAISRDRPISTVLISPRLAGSASEWKTSARVFNFFQKEVEKIEDWKQQIENNAIISVSPGNSTDDMDSEPSDKGGGFGIPDNKNVIKTLNYSERGVMLKTLNELANNAKDPKEKLDALKIIADLQRFKDFATSEKPEIKRFYMPLKCSECEIYKQQKTKISE